MRAVEITATQKSFSTFQWGENKPRKDQPFEQALSNSFWPRPPSMGRRHLHFQMPLQTVIPDLWLQVMPEVACQLLLRAKHATLRGTLQT